MASTRPPDGYWAKRPQHRCRFCPFDTLEGSGRIEKHELEMHGDELLRLNDPLIDAATAPIGASGGPIAPAPSATPASPSETDASAPAQAPR